MKGKAKTSLHKEFPTLASILSFFIFLVTESVSNSLPSYDPQLIVIRQNTTTQYVLLC
jgi:hypothetical protein